MEYERLCSSPGNTSIAWILQTITGIRDIATCMIAELAILIMFSLFFHIYSNMMLAGILVSINYGWIHLCYCGPLLYRFSPIYLVLCAWLQNVMQPIFLAWQWKEIPTDSKTLPVSHAIAPSEDSSKINKTMNKAWTAYE